MDLRKSVFRNLHSVFENDPQSRVAFHLTHYLGVEWSVREFLLSTRKRGDTETETFDLSAGTIGDLVAQLTQKGYDVSFIDAEITSRLAACLLDGEGDDQGSNEEVLAFDNPLWALLSAPDKEVTVARDAMDAAIAQLVFTQSEGAWLDYWGTWFDIPRSGLADADYAVFMRDEIVRGRANNYAIQNAVKAWTGLDVVIREPWKELFIWDKSHFGNGDTRWQDGNFYTFGTLQPRGDLRPEQWPLVEYVVDRNRALGCYRLPSEFDPGVIGALWGDIVVGAALVEARANLVLWGDWPEGTPCLCEEQERGVGTRIYGDRYHSELIQSTALAWTGSWDDRTWISETNIITYGYAITEESA